MVTETKPIRGKIAKVLNSREVAINVGEEQGVEVGMVFDILAPNGDVIRDPDTHAELGFVEQAKSRVKVTRAYEKFAVASTFRSREVNVGGKGLLSLPLGSAFDPPKWETRYETLKIEGGFEAAAEEMGEHESYVSRGDPVVQVVGDR